MGIPWLSEANRFIWYLHGGGSPLGRLDRFSTFRAGGGPFPNESDDLYRLPYPGALYNNFPVSDYVVQYHRIPPGTVVLSLSAPARHLCLGSQPARLQHGSGAATPLESNRRGGLFNRLTSGFISDSQLYLEYAYDSKLLRNGTPGSSIMLLWSKSF